MISFIIFNGEGISTILENIGGLFKFVSIPLITNESMYYLKSYIIVIILRYYRDNTNMQKYIN